MGAKQKICVVIGDPVAQSLSPAMHSAAYKALGIEQEYQFKPHRVSAHELGDFMAASKDVIHAMAVTFPHKETIIPYLDKLEDNAKEIGAVNTVVNHDGVLMGYNTDGPGALNTLKQHTELAGKAVVVLGTGGTAKAILYGLYKEGLRPIICSRNTTEAERLAAKYNAVSLVWEGIGNVAEADILINTTPIGRQGEEFPHVIENLRDRQKLDNAGKPAQIIFDVNYNPNGIPLLKDAKKLGLTVIDGLELLLHQGTLQFELYTGLKAPVEAMRKALNQSQHAYII